MAVTTGTLKSHYLNDNVPIVWDEMTVYRLHLGNENVPIVYINDGVPIDIDNDNLPIVLFGADILPIASIMTMSRMHWPRMKVYRLHRPRMKASRL